MQHAESLITSSFSDDAQKQINLQEALRLVELLISRTEASADLNGLDLTEVHILRFRICGMLSDWQRALDSLKAALLSSRSSNQQSYVAAQYAMMIAAMYEGTENHEIGRQLIDQLTEQDSFGPYDADDQARLFKSTKRRFTTISRMTETDQRALQDHLQQLDRLIEDLPFAALFTANEVLGRPRFPSSFDDLLSRYPSFDVFPFAEFLKQNKMVSPLSTEPVQLPASVESTNDTVNDRAVNSQLDSIESLILKYSGDDAFLLSQIALARGCMAENSKKADAAIEHYQQAVDHLLSNGCNGRGLVASIRGRIDDLWTKLVDEEFRGQDWTTYKKLSSEHIAWSVRELGDLHWHTLDLQRVRDIAIASVRLTESDRGFLLNSIPKLADESSLGVHPRYPSDKQSFRVREELSELLGRMVRRSRLMGGKDPFAPVLLARQAELEITRGNLDRAEKLLDEALDRQQKQFPKWHPNYVKLLNTRAAVHRMNGELERALQRRSEATAIGSRIGNYQTHEFIHEQRSRTVTVLVSTGSHDEQIAALESDFSSLMERSDYVNAESTARSMLELCESVHGKESIEAALASANLASVWAETGDFQQSRIWYERALQRVGENEISRSTQMARLQHNLALVAEQLGDLAEAESLYASAILLSDKLKDPLIGKMRLGHAIALRRSGRFQEAELELAQAKTAIEKDSAASPMTVISQMLESAVVAALLNDLQRSREQLGVSQKYINKMSSQEVPLPARIQLAYAQSILHYSSQSYPEAIRTLEQATDLALAEMQVASQFQTPRQQVAAASAGRESLDALLTVLEVHPEAAPRVYRFVPSFKSVGWQVAKEWRAALENEQVRMDQESLNAVRNELSTYANQISAAAFQLPALDQGDRHQNEGHIERNSRIENLRILQEELQRKLAIGIAKTRSTRADSDLKQIIESIPAESVVVDFVCYRHQPWTQTKDDSERLAAFLVRPDGSIRFIQLPSSDVEVAEMIRSWSTRNYSASDKLDITLHRKLRASVWDPIEAELLATDKLLFLCPEGAVSLVPFAALPGRTDGTFLIEEDRRISYLPTPLMLFPRSESSDPSSGLPAADPYAIPVDSSQTQGRHQLELLVVGDSHFGDVAEDNPAATGHQSRIQTALRQWKPLPGAALEVYDIRNDFEQSHPYPDAEYRLLVRTLASSDHVVDLLTQSRHVHFATHGFFGRNLGSSILLARPRYGVNSPEAPAFSPVAMSSLYPGLLSGLALANANDPRGDGLLTALEIGQLDLSNLDTVVLSACETAIGDYQRGEGQMSLQWAFHQAGAKTCVSSLWKVPDGATSHLMQKFYEHLWNGESKLEALRAAQIWALRNPAEASRGASIESSGPSNRLPPYYWAAFVLTGEWR